MKTGTRNLLITGLAVWVLIIVGLLVAIGIRLTAGSSSDGPSTDGPPPDLSDFDTVRPTIPGATDEESTLASDKNAYSHLVAARYVMYFPLEAFRILVSAEDDANNQAMVEELVAKNTRTFELIAEAMQCDILLMPQKVSPRDDDPAPFLRYLKQILKYKVDTELKKEEYAEAVNTCNILLKFGQLYQTAPGDFRDWSIGKDLQSDALQRIRKLALIPDLPDSLLAGLCECFSTPKEVNDRFEYALKTECRQEIASLYDFLKTSRREKKPDAMSNSGSDSRPSIRQPNPAGRMKGSGALQANKTKGLPDIFREALRCTSVPLTELPELQRDRINQQLEQQLDEMKQMSFLSVLFRKNTIENTFGKAFLSSLTLYLSREVAAKYQLEADLIMTRTVVACTRYERQYGKWPESLDALVPEFMDAAPIDPFDGKPLRYDPARGVIYSINRDLIDSGGSTKNFDDAVYSIREEPMTQTPQ